MFGVAELTATQIELLDGARRVVILPGGILEQHAGHSPAYTDGFMNQHILDSLANAIAGRRRYLRRRPDGALTSPEPDWENREPWALKADR